MVIEELIPGTTGTAASIAKKIVVGAAKNYVAADLEAAVEMAISKFAVQMREAAKKEIKFQKIKKIEPNK